MRKAAAKLTKILGSDWFFFAVLGFFIFEALWIALSAFYPMAFDEEFHFRITQLYADNVWPMLPAGAETSGQFGPVYRDPSFLYHWLQGFPYRLFHLFSDSHAGAIIFLRLLNIAMFTTGMLLFYRLMRRVGMSAAFSNAALALFVLIPVVPLLAAQINYDNLLMIFAALACLLVVRLQSGFQKREFDARSAAWLVVVCIFGSLVKFAFMPLAAALLAFCVVSAWLSFRGRRGFGRSLVQGYKRLGRWFKLGLLALVVLGLGMAIQRYGVNVVRYGTPLPDCGVVLTTQQCLNFPPWQRNYLFAQDKPAADPNPAAYTLVWLENLHKRLFFMINGPHHAEYRNYPPPPILANTATVVALGALAAVGLFGVRAVRKRPVLSALLAMAVVYSAALWATNYAEYLETGRVVAVNGRYLIPILLPLAAVAGAALHLALRRAQLAKPFLAVLAIGLFLQGGGVTSYILRSDPSWHWPHLTVRQVNSTAQKVLDPLIYQGGTEYKKD